MPWYGWAYLGLLCLIGAGGFVAGLRAGRARLAFLHLAAVTVLAWGVALYFRGEVAGIAPGLALLCAIAVLARKSFARSEERPVGKECVRTCRFQGAPRH